MIDVPTANPDEGQRRWKITTEDFEPFLSGTVVQEMISPRVAMWCRVEGKYIVVDIGQGVEAGVDICLTGQRFSEFVFDVLTQ